LASSPLCLCVHVTSSPPASQRETVNFGDPGGSCHPYMVVVFILTNQEAGYNTKRYFVVLELSMPNRSQQCLVLPPPYALLCVHDPDARRQLSRRDAQQPTAGQLGTEPPAKTAWASDSILLTSRRAYPTVIRDLNGIGSRGQCRFGICKTRSTTRPKPEITGVYGAGRGQRHRRGQRNSVPSRSAGENEKGILKHARGWTSAMIRQGTTWATGDEC